MTRHGLQTQNSFGRFTPSDVEAKRAMADQHRREERKRLYDAQEQAVKDAEAARAKADADFAAQADRLHPNVLAVLSREPSKAASLGVSEGLARWLHTRFAASVMAGTEAALRNQLESVARAQEAGR